jgi:serine/threonine protein kinase
LLLRVSGSPASIASKCAMTGRTLLQYQIGIKLGAGGMGEVYKAKDTRLGRDVAIKVLPEGMTGNQDSRQRFLREARAASLLNHPNIVTIHDIAEADGAQFIVMEYVPGKTLRDAIPSHGMEPAAALRYGQQIAGALAKAHGAGIVHRDLKPANIMVTQDDIVKVVDFGLAKLIESHLIGESDATLTAQTQAGAILGTAAYMSPEQAEGKLVDARSDIFSFGLVLYEMLSGQHAFAGDSPVAILAAILRAEPARLRNISPELDRIVTRCLRKDPASRFQTMQDVRQALDEATGKPALVAEAIPSIAVLPFANLSGDKDNEYFSDGLAEEIINALTKLPGLKVTARSSAFAFKGKNEDVRQIGQALNAAHILEGSVRRAGGRVRVTAQLIAIGDGCHLWSERYDREMNDIFAIQDEISQAIVDALKVKLAPQAVVESHRTRNLEAYTAYLEGRYHFGQYTAAGISRSFECFERAIALEPDYAPAHAGLAEAYLYVTFFSPMRPRDAVAKAMAAAERAIQLTPDAVDGYLARGLIRGTCEYNWIGAAQDFDHALQLNPDFPMAHIRRAIWYLVPVGRIEEALVEIQRALELDPLSELARSMEAWILHLAGRGTAAVEHIRVALQLFPNYVLGAWLSGWVLAGEGLFEEAETALRRALQIDDPGNSWVSSVLAAIYGRQSQSTDDWLRSLERAGEASRILAQMEELSSRQHVSPLAFAMTHTALGDLEKAYEWWEKAVEERETWLALVLREPLYSEPLAGPRYQALLRKANLV